MSRHKIVKNLDLDDELDDFDGGDDYDYDYGAEETGGDNSVVGGAFPPPLQSSHSIALLGILYWE